MTRPHPPRAPAWLITLLVFAASEFGLVAPGHAFLPGALSPSQEESLVRAGAAGVAPARALRLRVDGTGRPTRWNLLVVLVDFPDRPGDRGADGPAAWHRRVFGADPARPSLADYYREDSSGRLEIQGLVTSWVRMSEPAAFYLSDGAGNLGGGVDPGAYPHNSQRLVEEALARLGDGYRWPDFDNNGDGLVDGLLVVAAGAGAEETAPLSDPANRVRLLAHQFHTTHEVPVGASRAFDYAVVAADAPLGTVAHEVGHLFGLIDLYQTGSFASAAGPFGLGDWSLMGTGALLDGGRTPSHLDAWSRARLGFVSPEPVALAREDLRLAPAITGGTVLRLGRGAQPDEYLLAETRVREGFDAALPGEGLLVYHVYEQSQTNSSPSRYRVALLQADGRNDLGRVGGNRGDTGDPWPGTAGAAELSDATTPNSLTYDGADTGARLARIREDAAGIVLDAWIDAPPDLRCVAWSLREVAGDGDGVVTPGEEGAIDLTLENFGGAISTGENTLALAALDPHIAMLRSLADLGSFAAGEQRHLPDLFRFRVGPDFPAAESAIRFERIQAYRACASCDPFVASDTVALAIGAYVPFADDFEQDDPRWSHGPGSPVGRDQWHRSSLMTHSGGVAWFCGAENGGPYERGMDARLETNGIRVPPRGRLSFWQSVAAESLSTDRAWDGGRVEVRIPGGAWQALRPLDGYPFTLETGSGNRLFGEDVFSGRRDWRLSVMDLSAFSGATIDLRFRFATDLFDGAPLPGPDGWWIDDVTVAAGGAPIVPIASVDAGGLVLVRWDVPSPPPDVDAWRLSRRRTDPAAVPIPIARMAGAQTGPQGVSDRPPPGPWIYRLEGERDGAVVAAAEIAAPLVVPIPGLLPEIVGLYPVPYRPTGPALSVEIRIPSSSRIVSGSIEIFDVQGRRVARLPWTSGEGAVYRVAWDGRGERGPIRSGIYWVRLRGLDERGGEEVGMSRRLVVVT